MTQTIVTEEVLKKQEGNIHISAQTMTQQTLIIILHVVDYLSILYILNYSYQVNVECSNSSYNTSTRMEETKFYWSGDSGHTIAQMTVLVVTLLNLVPLCH